MNKKTGGVKPSREVAGQDLPKSSEMRVVAFRVTEEEYRRLRIHAATEGTTVNHVLRSLLKQAKVLP
jgi:hypothetical protein